MNGALAPYYAGPVTGPCAGHWRGRGARCPGLDGRCMPWFAGMEPTIPWRRRVAGLPPLTPDPCASAPVTCHPEE